VKVIGSDPGAFPGKLLQMPEFFKVTKDPQTMPMQQKCNGQHQQAAGPLKKP
jgi:hypothetical protein